MGLNLLKILAKVTFHNALIVLSYRLCLARSDAGEHKNNRRSEQSANATTRPAKTPFDSKKFRRQQGPIALSH
jgi:hypothetical protein